MADARVYKLVAVEGGFYLTTEIDGATKYYNIRVNGNYVNLLIEDTAESVWVWSETYQTLTVTVPDKGEYAITQTGTYSNVEAKTVSTDGVKVQLYTYIVPHYHDYTETTVDPTCTVAGSLTKTCECGKEIVTAIPATGHNYVEGVCSSCGAEEPVVNPGEEVTASKSIADLIISEGWDNNTTKQSFSLDDNVTVKVDGGSNSGKAYSENHIRIYATDSPAGTLTISVAEGYELVSVKISTQTGTYAYLCVNGTTTDICNTTTAVSGSSVVLNSVKNGTDGKQVRITAIEVVYKAVES